MRRDRTVNFPARRALANNAPESDVRKAARHRNTRHNFRAVRSMSSFAALFRFAETAKKNGMRPAGAIVHRVE